MILAWLGCRVLEHPNLGGSEAEKPGGFEVPNPRDPLVGIMHMAFSSLPCHPPMPSTASKDPW